jgi:hypothetical protein
MLFCALTSSSLTTSAQTCVVTEDFSNGTGKFSFSNNFHYRNEQLEVDIPRDINVTTTATVTTPFYTNPSPMGSATVGFTLEGYTAGTTYTVSIQTASGTILTTTPVLINQNPNANANATICRTIISPLITNEEPIRFVITFFIPDPAGNGNVVQATIFDNFSIGAIAAAPLPVVFKDITAKKEGNNVKLYWNVGQEFNVVRYEIERSSNGKEFTKVGEISAANSTNYNFSDNQPINGVGIYRVKNVDQDGKSKYSSIVRVNLSQNVVLKAFPLPAGNQLTVEHEICTSAATLAISTIDGKVIYTQQVSKGSSTTLINTSVLKSGFYLLRFNNGIGNTEILKLVKQ